MCSCSTARARFATAVRRTATTTTPASVPQAAEEPFSDVPPGTWLLRHVAWTEAEHVIGARVADAALARRLGLTRGDACLTLDRRTWQGGDLITTVRLTYPADRHSFTGRFVTGESR